LTGLCHNLPDRSHLTQFNRAFLLTIHGVSVCYRHREMKNRPFLQRLRFALAGIAYALRTESSFRTHAIAAATALAALAWLRPAPVWWALVALTTVAVLAAELFNTALEQLADRLHPEEHPQIKVAKDCGAAAVLVFSIGAVVVAAAMLLEALAR
jgi:diacylglycerol kinase (ATP)